MAESQALTRTPEHAIAHVGTGALPAQVDEIAAEAAVLQQKWGTSTQLTPQDFHALCVIARESGMSPVWDLDVLNGRPYDKASFWAGVLADHPNVVSLHEQRIRPGTDEWDEYIGVEEPDVIAWAVLCVVEMRNRRLPIIEANYVLKSDPILYEKGGNAVHHGEGDGAKAEAEAIERDGGKKWFDPGPGQGKKWAKKKGWWSQGAATLAPDWRAKAAKKARSTALRRAAKIAVPMAHAKVLAGMNRIERLVETRERSGPHAHISTPADPFSAPALPRRAGEKQEVHQALPPASTISEEHRRMVWAQASRKNLGENDLRALIARTLSIPVGDVHVSQLTYEQLPQVAEAIEAIPDEDLEDGDGEEQHPSATTPAAEAGESASDGPPAHWADVPPPELELGGRGGR